MTWSSSCYLLESENCKEWLCLFWIWRQVQNPHPIETFLISLLVFGILSFVALGTLISSSWLRITNSIKSTQDYQSIWDPSMHLACSSRYLVNKSLRSFTIWYSLNTDEIEVVLLMLILTWFSCLLWFIVSIWIIGMFF